MNIYGLFGKGDIPGLIGNLADNVEWDLHLNPLFGSAWVYRGQKDVYNFFGELRASAEITAFVPHHFYEKDNVVFILGSFEYTRLSATARSFMSIGQCLLLMKTVKSRVFQKRLSSQWL